MERYKVIAPKLLNLIRENYGCDYWDGYASNGMNKGELV